MPPPQLKPQRPCYPRDGTQCQPQAQAHYPLTTYSSFPAGCQPSQLQGLHPSLPLSHSVRNPKGEKNSHTHQPSAHGKNAQNSDIKAQSWECSWGFDCAISAGSPKRVKSLLGSFIHSVSQEVHVEHSLYSRPVETPRRIMHRVHPRVGDAARLRWHTAW